MFRKLIFPIALAGLAACASPQPHLIGETSGLAQSADVDLRVSGNRIYLPARLNGVATEALLDSGAELSLVDQEFSAIAGLTAFGHAEARGTGAGTADVQFAEGVRIEAAGLMLSDKTVAIMDLSDISQRLAGNALTLILGREFFDAGLWHIDIKAATLRSLLPDELPGGSALVLTDAHGIKQVDILINGIAVKADFDLGNGSEVLLSQDFAERAGLLAPEKILGTKEGGGVGGAITRTLVHVDTLEIGGHVLTDVTAAVSPQSDGAQANIGVSVLRNFTWVIDFPGNRVWMEPNP